MTPETSALLHNAPPPLGTAELMSNITRESGLWLFLHTGVAITITVDRGRNEQVNVSSPLFKIREMLDNLPYLSYLSQSQFPRL